MHEIADVLEFGLQASPDGLFVFLQVELPDELFPVDQGLGLELAVVEEEVDLLGSEGYVQIPESLFEHEVSDPSALFFIDFLESLF